MTDLTTLRKQIEDLFPDFSWLVRSVSSAELTEHADLALIIGTDPALTKSYFAHLHDEVIVPSKNAYRTSFQAQADTAEEALANALAMAISWRAKTPAPNEDGSSD
jgi:hypothetical protein